MEEEKDIILAKPIHYWISSGALSIQLNALGEPNRIQASVAGGAQVMAYIRGVKAADPEDPDTAGNGDGLEYDVAHNYRHWPIAISPTYFNTNTAKYLYVRIPKTEDAGTEAQVVFPSVLLDLYGYELEETEDPETGTKAYRRKGGEPLGDQNFFFIWLQGIISDSGDAGTTAREWLAQPDSGMLNTDEAYSTTETEWYRWEPISGTVTFLKEIWMSAESWFQNLQAKDAVVKGVLSVKGYIDAAKAYIDEIRSKNFAAGLLDGAGFRLTNDNGEGGSELEVDFLKVRKKATFMELEIRKETFVGGNQNYSPAGSVLYRVDYMTEDDELVGYSVMKVPFLLTRFAFLGHVFNYAARKKVRRALKPEEWPTVHHFRCYLLADDGTTATRNWWRAGDQARCQSFNKAKNAAAKEVWDAGGAPAEDPSEPMAQYNTGSTPIETAYYWRLVSNTGSERLEDGHVYDYIDMPYEGWYGYTEREKASFRDGGSGIPVAGDTIVCMGNRTEKDRMNMVSIQTTGAENNPPAIKGYRGIHTFRLQDENRVFNISPEEILFRSKYFRFLDDSGYEFPVPLERGEWQPGIRYHWYDRVSWMGSIWLCMVLDDYVWEDDHGRVYEKWDVTDIEPGEGNFTYYATGEPGMEPGETLTGYDHYYEKGMAGGVEVYYIRMYTYTEPGPKNNLWMREVSKGTEITESVVHYAASLDGVSHPDDDSEAWKKTIEETGILAGQFLWTRRTTYYDDPNNPDREPTREYSVARWGIDGDGIAEIDAYYTCMQEEISDMAAWENTHVVTWYYSFEDAVSATQHTIGELQGWYIWEKTQIIYDMAPAPDGSPRPKPDLVNYRVSRIGQDGQIGQEEYYCLREYDTYEKAFPPSFEWAAPFDVGIQWNNQRHPEEDDWRLFNSDSWAEKICNEQSAPYAPWYQTSRHPDCPVWSPTMPAYDDSTPEKAKKKFLWNFEQRVDGMGTQYATRPICIGDHSRGIMGVLELYALSAAGQPQTAGRHIPDDIWDANGGSETDYSHSDQTKPKTWDDEVYNRAPTEDLPYQWNWTRTLYNQPRHPGGKMPDGTSEPTDANTGYWYEDHWHVSAVKGTKGEDGSGVEYIYCRTKTSAPPPGYDNHAGNVRNYGHIDASETVTVDGKTIPRCLYDDDFVPDPKTVGGTTYTWTDNPVGVDHDWPYEWACERKSQSYLAGGKFTGGHIWSEFEAPTVWSKWGDNGQDGDGTEYVFIRTKTDSAPVLLANDGGTAADYESQEWRPYVNGSGRTDIETNDGTAARPRCTDDPKGTSRDWPYEWVAKRTMTAPSTAAADYGRRKWKSYYASVGTPYKLSKWSTYSTLRLDIDNEMDMVPTESTGYIRAAHTVETVVRLYDGATEIDLSGAAVGSGGIVLTGEPAASIATRSDGTSGKGRRLSWAFKAGQTMADAYEIGITYTYNNVTYQAVFTVSASKGQRIYQLAPLLSALICQRNDDNTLSNPPALSLAVNRIDGGSSTVIAAPTADATYKDGDVTLTVRYSTTAMPSSASAGSAWPKANSVQVDAGGSVSNVYFALFNSSGVLLDRETVPVIRDGKHGKSITKVSEAYRYATNATGVRPAASSSDWKTAKPALQKGYWLYVETTITWSDDSTTVLYTEERNPNDGVAGQDIIVDGSTEMKYYVGDSNTSHPAESSADWKDLSQVTQTQGKWLWSKATTWYRKASSAAGSKDAGHSVNYNVSYISKDGAAGRAITRITEYYKATDSDAEMSVPTSDTGWSTNPNVPGWGASARYLWNYEKVEYSSGTTVERTKPQIVAIWTEDGKGIDSIVNYYKITSSATAPSRPSVDGGDGWDDDPTAPGDGEYLWNYEKITYTDGSVFRSGVQLIGHVGENGVAYTIDCADVVKPSDTVLAVYVIKSYGESVERKNLTDASAGWSVGLSASVSGSGSAAVDAPNTRVTLSSFTSATVLTLTLKKNGSAVATKTVRCVSDGARGETGHVGRWYYYAGIYDGTPAHYKMEKTRSPFVKQSATSNNFWMLDFSGVEPDGHEKTASKAPTASGQTEWTSMLATFQYIITEAVFANFARLGSFCINSDWMLSKFGRVYFSNNAYTDITSDSDYDTFVSTYNVEPYTTFDPSYPTSGKSGVMNFCPNYAVDGRSGETYQLKAHVEGEVVVRNSNGEGVVRINGDTTSKTTAESGVTILDAAGLYSRSGNDGFRINGANGLERYDNRTSSFVPMFAQRRVDVISSDKTIDKTYDFILAKNTTNFTLTLPTVSAAGQGKIFTIQSTSQDRSVIVKASGSDKFIAGSSVQTTSVSVNNYERLELVGYGGIWYAIRQVWENAD